MQHQYRQGDVWLELVEAVPAGARKVERDSRGIVLAEGEATGHAHAVLDPAATLYETDLHERFLQIVGGATVTHEEHDAIVLPDGIYKIGQQREYSPEAVRNVAD